MKQGNNVREKLFLSLLIRIRSIKLFNLVPIITRCSKTYDMDSPKVAMVKELISSDVVVIFSKTYCPYCNLAKDVFKKINQKFTAIELDSRSDAEEIQYILGEITGAKTVPRVFVKGECLGGGSDVKALHDSGKLKTYFGDS